MLLQRPKRLRTPLVWLGLALTAGTFGPTFGQADSASADSTQGIAPAVAGAAEAVDLSPDPNEPCSGTERLAWSNLGRGLCRWIKETNRAQSANSGVAFGGSIGFPDELDRELREAFPGHLFYRFRTWGKFRGRFDEPRTHLAVVTGEGEVVDHLPGDEFSREFFEVLKSTRARTRSEAQELVELLVAALTLPFEDDLPPDGRSRQVLRWNGKWFQIDVMRGDRSKKILIPWKPNRGFGRARITNF